MISKVFSLLSNPSKLLYSFGSRGYLKFISDESFLKIMYQARMDKKLDLDNPTTFNEKLQWLKLYDRNPLYSTLVDKYEVREYVKQKIGNKYLIPLLGVWDNFDQIDFSNFPNQFVLKTTHDSGGVVICNNKSTFNIEKAKVKINNSLNRNYYDANREWVYKDLIPRVIAEEYLTDNNNEGLNDYKFFCFNGEVKAMFIASDRNNNTKFDFFDRDFNRLPLKQYYSNSKETIKKPVGFNKMIDLAEKLSIDMPHVRVDFYNNEGKIFFGELTFYHFSGARKFEPEKYDEIFGDWINLDLVKV